MPIVPNIRSHDDRTNDGIAKPIIGMPHDAAMGSGQTASSLIPARPQAYLDTPSLIYSRWNAAVGDIDQPLGTLLSDFSVCLIGGGISNLVAAFELAKAGAKVIVYDTGSEVGGRLRSEPTADSRNVAEMGAMRFPPSEDLLYYYAKNLGFGFMKGFPDPGVNSTVISYQGVAEVWASSSSPPVGFETVYNGWIAFCSQGLKSRGRQMLESASTLQKWLGKPLSYFIQIQTAWQAYLDEFKYNTFLDGLQRIFGSNAEWDVPGGKNWSSDDFKRFGALGLGSGGFGPLYEVAFTTVFRLVPNGLETDQAIFCTPQSRGDPIPTGIQQLAISVKNKAIASGASIVLNTFADVVSQDSNSVVVSVTTNGKPTTQQTFDFVIIGVTTKAMAVNMSAASNPSLFSGQSITDGINDVHITSSSKLFIRTKRFWANKGGDFPRNILSDSEKLPQLYTLDYGDPSYGMVLMTYTWEDQSNDIAAFTDPKKLFQNIKNQAAQIMQNTPYKEWADNLAPITENDYWLIHWQNQQYFNGAFVLGQPMNDPMTASMFLDFLKLSSNNHPRLLLNGDSIGFSGGWIDGGLQCAMNTVSAVLKTYGTLSKKGGADLLAPINLISDFEEGGFSYKYY